MASGLSAISVTLSLILLVARIVRLANRKTGATQELTEEQEWENWKKSAQTDSIPRNTFWNGKQYAFSLDLPNFKQEWVIEIADSKSPAIKKEVIESIRSEWQQLFPAADLFGYTEKMGKWHNLLITDYHNDYGFQLIHVRINLLRLFDDNTHNFSDAKAENYLDSVKEYFGKYSTTFSFTPLQSVEKAIEQAKEIVPLHQQSRQQTIQLLVKSETVFTRAVIMAMLDLQGYTVTEKGDHTYEAVIPDKGMFTLQQPSGGNELHFSFIALACNDSLYTFGKMYDTAQLFLKSGGTLSDDKGRSVNKQALSNRVEHLAKSMKAIGVAPGNLQYWSE